MLQEFIENNYKTIRISDKLSLKIEKHYLFTKALLEQYNLRHPLDAPLVEYGRYTLMRGTEFERSVLSTGIKTRLQLRNNKLEIMPNSKIQ